MTDRPGRRRLSLILLGGFAVTLDGEPVTGFDSNKVRSLLAYLAVEADRAHRRESLAALLWPGYPDGSARTNLRNALANLRTAIGDGEADPPFLWITRDTLQFNAESDQRLDVAVVTQALAEAADLATSDLVAAADAYTGDFLAGFTLTDAVDFDDWAATTRARLRRQAQDLFGIVVDRLVTDGDRDRALTYARRRVELEPWLESAQRQLIRLLAATGRRSAALRQYRNCVQVLREELGAEPSPETCGLYEELRAGPAGEVAGVASVRPSGPAVPDRRLPAFLLEGAEPAVREQPVFVGREPELARLSGYLGTALAGQGQVAFVVGGPGRGKTALLRAFAERAMAAHPDLLVVRGACNATSGVGDAYLPFRDALGMLTGDVEMRWRAGRVSTDQARRLWAAMARVLDLVITHGPSVIGVLVVGAALRSRIAQAGLGNAPWADELRALCNRSPAGDMAQQALFCQVTDSLLAIADVHPILLILDDLQWIDQGSVGLLFHLSRYLVGHSIFIVAAYRPEEVARRWSSGSGQERHPLAPVLDEVRRRVGDAWIDLRQADEAEGTAFVEALIDAERNRLGSALRQALYRRTGGHPLFTVELLRDLHLRGDLIRDDDGVWCEGEALDLGTLPARVEAVIAARLSRLDTALRALLDVAAVEGEVFTAQVLSQALGVPDRAVLRMLKQDLMTRNRLVIEAEEVRVGDHFVTQFAFAHALYQEQVYAALSGAERQSLHGEVGVALETLYGEQRDHIAVQLTHHYDLASKLQKAIRYGIRAADRAREAYAWDEAQRHYSRALALLQEVDPDDAALRQRLAALTGLGKLFLNSGRVHEAETCFREAIALGRQIGQDREELAILYHWLGEALTWQCRYEERLAVGREGKALFTDDTRSLGAALMNQLVAYGVGILGDWDQFETLTLQTARFIRDLPYTEELMPAYSHIRELYMWRKDIEAALLWARAWLDLCWESGSWVLESRPKSSYGLGLIAGARGYLDDAVEQRLYTLTVKRRLADTKHETWVQIDLAALFLASGDLDQATCYAEGALDLSHSVGYSRDIVYAQCLVGYVALCRGDWQRAMSAFRATEPIYLSYCDSRSSPPALPVTGDAAPDVVAVEPGEIALSYRICENCIRGLGAHLIGRAYLLAGDPGGARAHFDKSLRDLAHDYGGRDVAYLVFPALAGLAASLGSRPAFRQWCRTLFDAYPRFARVLRHWWLSPCEARSLDDYAIVTGGFDTVDGQWDWHDPLGDCGHTGDGDPEIRAANGRHMWHANMTAPRLMRSWPAGTVDGVLQTTCEPALPDRPAIGGLLVWKDKRDYLWLEVGRFGKRDVDFGGCIDNKDLVIGRGRLPGAPGAGWGMGEQVTLRVEVNGDHVKALCTLDGEQWYSVGHTTFPMDDTVQVGVHAIGMIDRTIYHGAYPEGTAIRFTDFRMWSCSTS